MVEGETDMKMWIKRITIVLLVISLLPWIGMKTNQAAAAGEVIEYNEYVSPARSHVQSRPASYAGDPDWYASTMYVDFPTNTFNVKYDQVRNLIYIDMSNSYLPSRFESYREALGNEPKNSSYYRAYHGHYIQWSQKLELVYKDGTAKTLNDLSSGWGGQMYTNGNLSGYENALTSSGLITGNPLKYYPILENGYVDWYFPKSIIPHSEYMTDAGKAPAFLRMTINYSELYGTYDRMDYSGTAHHRYGIIDEQIIPLTTNKKPNVTLTSQSGQTLMNEKGFSTFNLEGYVQDADNDTVDVVAEIPNLFYKKITLSNTASPKNFSIPIDVLTEGIPPGSYSVNVKVVDPLNFKNEASTSFSVTNRLRNKSFYLINSPIDIGTSYTDYENDSKYAERYRYDQDPSLFDNSMGIIYDSGLWRNSRYSSFPYSGAYTAIFQARDNPNGDDRFDAYRLWSKDNLSSMTFMIHRKPIALFSAKLSRTCKLIW